jgi:outer membrane protein insertion porin family
LSLVYVPPISDVRYWIASYNFAGYLPIYKRWVLTESVQAAYGKALGDTTTLPPFKRFYAGGPDTVRGYTEDTLGPVDTNGNPYGGNILTVARTELLILKRRYEVPGRGSGDPGQLQFQLS